MKALWLILLLACTALTGFGQANQKSTDCFKTAMIQSTMDECANEEAHRAEAQLDKTYQQLLTLANKDPMAIAKIKKAEAIWISYRQAYIDAMYPANDKQAEYGTMFPMEIDLLGAQLTRAHTKALQEIIKTYTDLE
ncbi:MAG: lysozyme inhibitor LprI family protein [Candidatus Acidiferrales bacterium]